MSSTETSLSDALKSFNRYFTVVTADEEMRERIFRMRYQVYCVEHPFENPDENPGEREMDAFDAHSVHAALIHNLSGELAGSVRLILPEATKPNLGLPALEICEELRRAFSAQGQMGRVAEISRYAISKQFRRRRFEDLHADVGLLAGAEARRDERRIMPFLTLGLIRATYDLSREHGVEHLLAVMDPLLLRLTARMGLNFMTYGPMVEHHGLRQPCAASIAELRAAFSATRPDMFRVVAENLNARSSAA